MQILHCSLCHAKTVIVAIIWRLYKNGCNRILALFLPLVSPPFDLE